jgi:hypothetical protein
VTSSDPSGGVWAQSGPDTNVYWQSAVSNPVDDMFEDLYLDDM